MEKKLIDFVAALVFLFCWVAGNILTVIEAAHLFSCDPEVLNIWDAGYS